MTSIEWTHRPGTKGESWNPIRARHLATGKIGWHCTHDSDGCRFCYAERLNRNGRNLAFGTGLPYKPGHEAEIEIFLDEKTLAQPLRWRQPRTIFVCSMTDLFGAFVPDAMIDRVFAVAALCPQHTFIVLTKRSARMRAYLSAARAHPVALAALEQTLIEHLRNASSHVGQGCIVKGDIAHLAVWPLPNVWLGVSAERQQEADERIPDLLATLAAIRFASLEPLLGPIMLHNLDGPGGTVLDGLTGKVLDEGGLVTRLHGLNWVIVGGESGPDARPMHPDWARALRDQCYAANVPFFFKQWGEWAPGECADFAPTQTERTASFFAGRWSFGSLTPKASEEMHRYDAPDLYRIGKQRAGRTLDGVEHNAWPSSPLEGEGPQDGRDTRLAQEARRAAGEPLAAPGEGSLS